MKKMKDIDYKIMAELIKNAKVSDRKLASKLDVSQPTVTRRRAMLEREQLLDYTALPNFNKLGFDMMIFTFLSGSHTEPSEFFQKLNNFVKNNSNVIYSSGGYGLQMEFIVISIHRNYSHYAKFRKDLHSALVGQLKVMQTFIVSFSGNTVLKNLSFNNFVNEIH